MRLGSYNRRQLLLDKGKYEVLEVTWPPGAKSEFHDHGISCGMIMVLEGKIFQKVYDKKTKKFLFHKTYKAGDVILETPDIIHQMGNVSNKKPAKSIHVYAPPLDAMHNYDFQNDNSWIVYREDFEKELNK